MADTAEFRRRLLRIPEALRDDMMELIEAEAERVAEVMRRVGPEDRTFALERSIKVYQDKSALRVRIKAGGPKTTRPVRTGLDLTYDYALAQEFGTREMPANPFFYPVWRLKRRSARSRIARGMKKVIQAAARKQGFPNG